MPEPAGAGRAEPSVAPSFQSWRLAWTEGLYGEHGFYRRPEGPGGHFETSANAGGGVRDLFAEALVMLARRHGCTMIVDLGAGRGELLGALHACTQRSSGPLPGPPESEALRLVGIDVVPAPHGLPAGIEWMAAPGGPDLPARLAGLADTMVIAHEWLDVVPLDVLETDRSGQPRLVEVDARGAERLGDPASAEQLAWCERWWPIDRTPGARIEVGLSRDRAWADLVGRLTSGLCVAIDYGHTAADRPAAGTLTGYRAGRQTAPVPDGSCDLTAHVALDSLEADEVLLQRAALLELGLSGARPTPAAAGGGDPAAYLRELARASAAATLLDPGGLGGFGWAITVVAQG